MEAFQKSTKTTRQTKKEDKMRTSENLSDLIVDLIKFQNEMPVLKKDSTVSMELKSGRKVEYDYIELGEIVKQSKEKLAKNNLSIIQPRSTVDGKPALFTMMLHKSGQYIQTYTLLELSGKTEQEKGSAITYNSRYDYVGMLRFGLLDEDDDGQSASGVKSSVSVNPADYAIKTKGNALGKKLSELSLDAIQKNINYWQKRAKDENSILKGTVKEDVEASIKYLQEQAELQEIK
jgi:hypothetical protein